MRYESGCATTRTILGHTDGACCHKRRKMTSFGNRVVVQHKWEKTFILVILGTAGKHRHFGCAVSDVEMSRVRRTGVRR